MRLTRWHVLAASFLAIFTGQPGPWGVYSDTIKTNFDLTQSQLDTVASANAYINIMMLSIVPGLIYDRISQRCGDRIAAVVILGTTGSTIAIGTICFWATVVGKFPVFFPGSLGGVTGQLTFFNAVLAWGGEFCTAAVIPIVIKNFPAHTAQVEFDEEDVPEHFRFEFQSAPCSKHQEIFRMGVDSLPCLVVLTKVRARASGARAHVGW